MLKSEIVEWVKTEFQPLQLATPDSVIAQQVDNAVRYFNTHSAFRTTVQVARPIDGTYVEIPAEIKAVAEVLPDRMESGIIQSQPIWSLLGVQVVDTMNTDLIMLGEAYKSYKQYLGAAFYWKFEQSNDPDLPGRLYVKNPPVGCASLFVVGTKRLYPNDDIRSEHILDWILRYTKALVKMIEGNTLRKAVIADVKSDGQELLNEGKEEKDKLQEEIVKNARWLAFARRF